MGSIKRWFFESTFVQNITDRNNTMTEKKNIFVIIGSASKNSANEKLMDYFAGLTKDAYHLNIFKDLKTLPHFDPELSVENPPKEIIEFRKSIENADGIIICTP